MRHIKNLALAGAATFQAPESGSGVVESEPAKRQIAKHYLLNADGDTVEDETEATGIRYVHIASGATFDFQVPEAKAGSPATMLAIFGAKTLATNEASAQRQKYGEDSDQVGAIRERFDLISNGQWVDRTREGGVRIDKDVLAEAAIQVYIAAGKLDENDAEAVGRAKSNLRQKFEDDPKSVTLVRQVEGVQAAYARLAGKATKSVDDLAALVG